MPPQFDVSEAMYRKIRCPDADHSRRRRPDPAACARASGGRGHRRRARDHSGRRAQSARALSRQDQRADRRLPRSQARHRGARKAGEPADDQGPESPLPLLPDRSRTWAPRHRDRARAAQAAPRPAGRLAGAGSRHAPARSQRRARAPAQHAARERVAPHRAGVGRARSALLPGDPPHGRGADRELHDLPGCRRTGRLRPRDRRRGLGHRPLLA